MTPLALSIPRRKGGFTLAEVLVCVIILGILGTALTRLMLAQSRLFQLQRAQRDARTVGRSSANLLFSDLRMVHDGADAPGGVLIASPETLKVRVPYAQGLVCGSGTGATTVSMLPTDSAVRAMSTYAGWAWRARLTGKYTYVPDTQSTPPVTSNNPSLCTTTAKIKTDTISTRSWLPLDLKPADITAGKQPGAAMFLYQEVTYWFGPSTTYPGRIALWRTLRNGSADELAAPFDATARFRFFVRNSDTPSDTPPAILDSLVGVSLVLTSASPTTMAGRAPEKARIETAVLFRNHPGF
jgi:prepilin-type N-terminal cleavage/methylation domain-containing protein